MWSDFGQSLTPLYLAHVTRLVHARNADYDVHAALGVVCTCGERYVRVQYAGVSGSSSSRVSFITYGSHTGLNVTADCPTCGARHELFDVCRHGWGPVLFPPSPHQPSLLQRAIWTCNDCGADQHEVEVVLGWSPFDEVAEDLAATRPFDQRLWVEAFETIQIHLKCRHCGLSTPLWLELEVV